jgi:hypothetical protein
MGYKTRTARASFVALAFSSNKLCNSLLQNCSAAPRSSSTDFVLNVEIVPCQGAIQDSDNIPNPRACHAL